MKTSLVLTLIGPDRPGLVESLSELVAAQQGNWEESRMAHLAGKFAGILLVELPSDRVEALREALATLEARGLRVIAETSERDDAPTRPRTLHLEVVGHDREGIVREISHALASRGVNVEELSTSCEAAPLAGGTLFRARAIVRLPQEAQIDDLRAALEALSDDLVVDLSAKPDASAAG